MYKSAALKTAFASFSLLLLTVLAYPTFAQDTATPSSARQQLLQRQTEARKEKVENRVVAIKEKEASRASNLKEKLQAFKDKVKAAAAERLNTNLNTVNQRQTSQMQKYLNTMSEILTKLEAKVNKPSPDIKDPVSAKAAINVAKQTIATASAAVVAQAQKDYTIQVTTESKIKADAKAERDLLHTDLTTLRKAVVDAKQAVANTIRVAKLGSGSGLNKTEVKEGTTSGKQ